MKITFELMNEQFVNIVSDGKIIGHIFTPGGSGDNVTNAVQVCGFDEAFDFWGCGIFGENKVIKKEYTEDQRKKFMELFETTGDAFWKDWAEKGCSVENVYVLKKDIQLLFSDYDRAKVNYYPDGCSRCYNKPCTCENAYDETFTALNPEGKGNPYNVRTHIELKDRLEYKNKAIAELNEELDKEEQK